MSSSSIDSHTRPGPGSSDGRAAVRRLVVLSLVPSVLVTAVALAVQIPALSEVPDPAAVHWSGGGPDGSGSPWTFPVMTALISGGLPILSIALSWSALRRGAVLSSQRMLAALMNGTAIFLAVALTWSLLVQRGLSDWQQAPSVNGIMLAGLLAGVVGGAAVWFLVRQTPEVDRGVEVESLEIAPGETAVWLRTTSLSPVGLAVAVGATLVTVVLAIVMWVTDETAPAIGLTVVAVVTAAAVAAVSVFRVRVDGTGLTVASVSGWPRFHVPCAEVADISVVDIEALGEFGGWGLRKVPGRLGIVTRSGEGLEVTRTDGRRLAVTVDDAATAASLLRAHVDRRN